MTHAVGLHRRHRRARTRACPIGPPAPRCSPDESLPACRARCCRAPEALPPAERRRAGRVIKLALAVGAEARRARRRRCAHGVPSVFSSSGGDGDNCHEICVALASSERRISPTRFHNSVHNAAAGYWSIAYGCTEASVDRCAPTTPASAPGCSKRCRKLAATRRPVLLLAYDADYPPPLQRSGTSRMRLASALLLAAAGIAARARRTAAAADCRPQAAEPARVTRQLEALRAAIPAARGLPLLRTAGAGGARGSVVLDYLDTAPAWRWSRRMRLDRHWIAGHIPHQGRMCLLDRGAVLGRQQHRMPASSTPSRAR